MRRTEIEDENRRMIERQRQFRMAADIVADAWMTFPEVHAIAVIGSVAGPLWKEVPRFRAFHRAGMEIWHECSDLDLALWIDSQERLGELRRVAVLALRKVYEADPRFGVAADHLDAFLIEPGSDRYLGRLCKFSSCPKGKPECMVPGCGAAPFNRRMADFTPHHDLLTPASDAMLYERGAGRLRFAARDLPATKDVKA